VAYKLKQTRKSLTIQTTIFIFVVILAIYLFLQSDFFLLQKVEVIGNQNLSKEKIVELADLPLKSDMFYLDLQRAARNLKIHPMIKDVQIYRKLPDSVVIKIMERTPLALIPDTEGFVLIDEEFIVLKKVKEISKFNLPLITGVIVPNGITNGQSVDNEKLLLAKQVIEATWDKAQNYFCEINLAQEDNIKMYTYEGIEVHFGDLSNFEHKYQLFKSLYNGKSVEQKLADIDYIDVSFEGLPVIKYKNGN